MYGGSKFELSKKLWRDVREDCGSYDAGVVKLLLEHGKHVFVRAEMCRSLREKLINPRRLWRATEVGDQQMEVLSIPFDGLGGDIPHSEHSA